VLGARVSVKKLQRGRVACANCEVEGDEDAGNSVLIARRDRGHRRCREDVQLHGLTVDYSGPVQYIGTAGRLGSGRQVDIHAPCPATAQASNSENAFEAQ